MNCRPQLEAIASYLSDFIALLPASARGAVGQHIQNCLGTVSQEFNTLEARIKGYESTAQPDRPVEPTTE